MQVDFRRFLGAGLIISSIVLGISAGPAAADEAAVKYRKTIMDAMAAHMGASVAIVKGQAGKPDHLPGHAEALAALGKMVKDVFPAGSDMGDTNALPVAWEKPDELMAKAKALEEATAEFAKVAASGDLQAAGAAMGAVGKTCGGCHSTFRKKR